MKRGTDMKLKFKELSTALGLRQWETKGLLQAIWDFTSENSPRGDIGRYTNEQIALGVEWDRSPSDSLIDALINAHWLDLSREHRIVVHDWHDHCEEWLKKRVVRSGETFASEKHKIVKARNISGKTSANGRQRQTTADTRQTTADNGSLPEPAPEPSLASIRARSAFDSFWETYPKRVGKGAALKAWKRINPDQATVDKILAAIKAQRSSPQWQRDGGQYIPHPATWLNAERWHDEVAPAYVDPDQAAWEAMVNGEPSYHPCHNPDCPEPEGMQAHKTRWCPFVIGADGQPLGEDRDRLPPGWKPWSREDKKDRTYGVRENAHAAG